MRKLMTTVATAVTLGVMGFAAPASADSYQGQNAYGVSGQPQGGYNQQGPRGNGYQGNGYRDNGPQGGSVDSYGYGNDGPRDFGGERGFGDREYGDRDFRGDRGFDDRRFDRDNRFNLHFDFGRHNGNFDRWERGWGNQGYGNYGYQQPLNYWRLVRRLEAQGFVGVRGLRQARWGFGYRAFAYTFRGQPVMLRINPYNGRVLDVRYI